MFFYSSFLILMGRLRYVEQELAKKRGKNIDAENQVENEVKRAEDELYKIPENLKVSDDHLFFTPLCCFPFANSRLHSPLTCTTIYMMFCGF